MSQRRVRFWTVIVALCLSSFTQSGSADEAAVRDSVSRFYAAYAREDLKGAAALWGEKSPDLAARLEALRLLFAIEDARFSNLSISRIKVTGDRATARVAVNLSAVNSETKEVRVERMMRNFTLFKEGGQWKLTGDESAVEELGAALGKAKTDEEHAALVAGEKELVTAELAESLIADGAHYSNQRDYGSALNSYAAARLVAAEIPDKRLLARSLAGAGNVHRARGESAEALEAYRKALAQFDRPGDEEEIAATLESIGLVHHSKRGYGAALENYQKALAIYEALEKRAGVIAMLDSIASVHYDRQDYGAALEAFQKSLRLEREQGSKRETAATLNNIGIVYYAGGDYERALEHYRESLALAEDKSAIAGTLRNVAGVHFSQGDHAGALLDYQKSLAVEEETGNREGIASALLGIGLVHGSLGNYRVALEYYRKSFSLREELGDKAAVAATLNNIALAHHWRGDYAAALESYRKSLTLNEEIGDRAAVASTLDSMGGLHYAEGDYAAALESYRKALAEFETLNDRAGMAGALSSIGNVHYSQASYGLALEDYQKAGAQYEALEDRAGIGGVTEKIGSVYYARGEYALAGEFANRAIALSKETRSADTLWRARFTVGAALRARGRMAEARQAFEEAVATIEAMRAEAVQANRSQRFFKDRASPYLAMVELLAGQDKAAEALAYAERIKAHVISDALESGRVKIDRGLSAEQQRQERKLTSEIASLQAQAESERRRKPPDQARLATTGARLEKARAEYAAFEAKLYREHPQLKAQRGEAGTFDLQATSGLTADPKSAALEFVVAEAKSYLFVLTSAPARKPLASRAAAVKVYTLAVRRKDLAERVTRFRQVISNRAEGFEQTAREIYDLLLKSARDELAGKAALLIVPDGVLWGLPFSALRPADDRYLIEEAAIHYAPSLAALGGVITPPRKRAGSRAGGPALLALGYPADAEREATTVARLNGARQGRAYTGADASEERAKAEAENYNLLHFAAAAAFDDSSPMYSHITLARTEDNRKEDGRLEAWELIRMDLKAALVAVSAGEPPRAQTSGDGIVGLSWALFVAGTPAVALSQWKVDPAARTRMMLEFYGALQPAARRPAPSKAQALQRAALKMMASAQYRHPFYWAGFSVIGIS